MSKQRQDPKGERKKKDSVRDDINKALDDEESFSFQRATDKYPNVLPGLVVGGVLGGLTGLGRRASRRAGVVQGAFVGGGAGAATGHAYDTMRADFKKMKRRK